MTTDDRSDTWVVDLHSYGGGADDPLGPSRARLTVSTSGLALTNEQRESVSHALARAFKGTVPDAERDVYTITIPGLDTQPDEDPDTYTEAEAIAVAIADGIAEADYKTTHPEPNADETPGPLAQPGEPNPDSDPGTYSDSQSDTSPESDPMRGESGQPGSVSRGAEATEAD